MDLVNADAQNTITKIEDVIDIQKANGNINVRQVAFRLPSETDSSISAGVAKSLETGLTKTKLEHKKKTKKIRNTKRQKGFISDLVSWPSDSDITVLRMKLYSNNSGDKKMRDIILGDGLHQPHSSSMVNLATLILNSQPPSKQSLVEECLLPLTSWEHAMEPDSKKPIVVPLSDTSELAEVKSYDARCGFKDELSLRDSDVCDSSTKSKVARFFRLYFCPCCTCLYELEKMQEDPSTCLTKR